MYTLIPMSMMVDFQWFIVLNRLKHKSANDPSNEESMLLQNNSRKQASDVYGAGIYLVYNFAVITYVFGQQCNSIQYITTQCLYIFLKTGSMWKSFELIYWQGSKERKF